MRETDSLALAAIREALRCANEYGEVTITVAVAEHVADVLTAPKKLRSQQSGAYTTGWRARHSKAEVLAKLRAGVEGLPAMPMVIGPWEGAGTADAVLVPAVLALIDELSGGGQEGAGR